MAAKGRRWVAVVRRLGSTTAPCAGRTRAPHQRAVLRRGGRRGWNVGRVDGTTPVRMGDGPTVRGSIYWRGGGAAARTVIHTRPQLAVTPPPLRRRWRVRLGKASSTTGRSEPPRSPAADPLRRRAVLWDCGACASPLRRAARKGPRDSLSRLGRPHGKLAAVKKATVRSRGVRTPRGRRRVH